MAEDLVAFTDHCRLVPPRPAPRAAGRLRAPRSPPTPRPWPESTGPLIELIHGASLAPERWSRVLSALARLLGGHAAGISGGPAETAPCLTATAGLADAAIQSYALRWGVLDLVTAGAASGGAWDAPATAHQIAGPALHRSAFFAGWMQPNGIEDLLCLSLLPPGARHRAVLGIARPPGRGCFGLEEVAALGRLAPHLRCAIEVHRRLNGPPAASPLAAALDQLAHALVLADADGTEVWANRAAATLLREGDGIALDRHGRLRAASGPAAEALRRAIADGARGHGAAIALPRPSGRAALTVLVGPIEGAPAAALPIGPTARLLLLLADPARGAPDTALEGRLRSAWGLTAAEATVAVQTAHGVGLPEVAAILGLAVSTARTHAQRVFAKAGLRGQAELARQVERLGLLQAAGGE